MNVDEDSWVSDFEPPKPNATSAFVRLQTSLLRGTVVSLYKSVSNSQDLSTRGIYCVVCASSDSPRS